MLNDIILDALNLDARTVLLASQRSVEFGYRNLWITEGIEREAFSLAAMISPILGETKTRVGTNLTNAYTRTPLLIAMSALTLDEITNQRFFLTIGSGGIGYIQRCHGMAFENPLARVREYTTFVRRLLTSKIGDKITFDGRFFGGVSFTLRSAPKGSPIDIYMSGLNPKMIQLAGELSDGLVLSHAPVEALDDVKRNIEIGAKKVGRDPSAVKIFVNSPAGLDNEESIEALRKLIAFHIAAPTYQHLLALSGYGNETKQIRDAWDAKDPKKATKMVTDDIIRITGLGCTQKDIRSKTRKLENSGAIPIIYPAVRSKNAAEDIVQILSFCRKATS